MPVIVTRNFPDLTTLPLVNREVMREVGLLARETILRRTVAGQSSAGGPFRPYSPAYAKLKGSTHVNLSLSGRMLNGITIVEVDDTSVTLGFKD